MTVKFGFYDSLNGDRLYNANDISTMFEGLFSDGVFESVGGGLQVEHNPGIMGVLVNTGRAWFNNLWIRNTATLALAISPSDLIHDRIDLVVLEFDSEITVRENSIKILTGTPSATPIPPILANTPTLHQYALAEVYITASVSEIEAVDITNRIGTVGTPYAKSLINDHGKLTGLEDDDHSQYYNQERGDARYLNLDGWIAGPGTWSYSSADAPTFVISINANVTALIGVGDRVKLTQTIQKFFIVTAVGSFSGGVTLVTVYGGTNYTLENTIITSPYYSHAKNPVGFPISPEKWTVSITDVTQRNQNSPTASTWYNLGSTSINAPIGVWLARYTVLAYGTLGSAGQITVLTTLSTSNNSESDATRTRKIHVQNAVLIEFSMQFDGVIVVTSKTTYYLNTKSNQNIGAIGNQNAQQTLVLSLVCAYL